MHNTDNCFMKKIAQDHLAISFSHNDARNITVDHVPYLSHDSDLRCHSYQIYFADIPTQRKILEELVLVIEYLGSRDMIHLLREH